MDSSTSTRLARDTRAHIPEARAIPSMIDLPNEHAAIWRHAAPNLTVRNNDSHTLFAYGLARALTPLVAGADPAVVMPAILLHDTGWSTVAEHDILEAIAPGGGRPDLVRQHEVEGARIARDVLTACGYEESEVDAVAAIIDGHDSRREAISPSDAVVKDADKIWRVTPHGLSIVSGWFGLTPEEALRITAARVHDTLLTAPGRAMAAAFIAAASIDLLPERQGLV